jgi:hypothetical protein
MASALVVKVIILVRTMIVRNFTDYQIVTFITKIRSMVHMFLTYVEVVSIVPII